MLFVLLILGCLVRSSSILFRVMRTGLPYIFTKSSITPCTTKTTFYIFQSEMFEEVVFVRNFLRVHDKDNFLIKYLLSNQTVFHMSGPFIHYTITFQNLHYSQPFNCSHLWGDVKTVFCTFYPNRFLQLCCIQAFSSNTESQVFAKDFD